MTKARTFEASHPWINFRLDLQRISHETWLLLGEAESKCEHLAGIPLRPKTSSYLHKLYLAKGVRGTAAIEGNTLTLAEVQARIDGTFNPPPSKEYLASEIDRLVELCNSISEPIIKEASFPPLAFDSLLAYNRRLLEGQPVAPEVVLGQVRRYAVGVPTESGSYRGAPAEDCEYLLRRLCDWLNEPRFNPDPKHRIAYLGLIRAAMAHLYLAWIHPFGDGNGRTARLVEFQLLLEAGVRTPAAHLLSNHFNETRGMYYRYLDRSSKTDQGPYDFLHYSIQGFVDGLKEQIGIVQMEHFDLAWRDMVGEVFQGKAGKTDVRRRELCLAIGHKGQVAIQAIRLLDQRIELAYRKLGDRTLTRDIEELKKLGLIKLTADGLVASSWERLGYFVPRRRPV